MRTGQPTEAKDNNLSSLLEGDGEYCCPICYVWYKTREEKQECLTTRHGYEILDIHPADPLKK